MQIVISLLILFTSLSWAFCGNEDFKDFAGKGYIFDNGDTFYDFIITRSALAKAPHWEAGSEYPPISPQKAQESALVEAKLILNKPELESIALELINENNWVYVVNYRVHIGRDSALPSLLTVPVYLDGSAIKPKLRKKSD